MKKINCANIDIAYTQSGQGKTSIVLLHGWGVDHSLMEPIGEHLAKYFTVYNLDWPGFGASALPEFAFSSSDFCRVLREFIEKLKIENPIFIAHSFGCNIALRYSAIYPVDKMVLTGAAGLKPKRGLNYYLKVYSYKALKPLKKIKFIEKMTKNMKFGSADYQAAQGVMRETFVKVVNEDLKAILPQIKTETLLVYGDRDVDTPLWMGQYLEKHLPNAGLAVIENDDHYAYYHRLPLFLAIVAAFLKDEINNAGNCN